ncbi:MAG: GrpB family protein [Thermomicrobiales bacterium]
MTAFILPYQPIRYDDPSDIFRSYDPRFPDVAASLIDRIAEALPGAAVEHIGSTAIPGCAGKGVIDLMLVYTADDGPPVAAAEAMGFAVYRSRDPFPDERPVLVGMFPYDRDAFRVHLHLIPAGTQEIEVQRRFRDRLRADPALVDAYVAAKRASLAATPADSTDYNRGKHAFIEKVIRR